MTEAVIVATARSPIGRANKGSLVDLRPDDMSAQIVKSLMDKVPEVSADDVEDLANSWPAPVTPIQLRLVLPLINTAAECLEAGVVSEPWMVDLGMVLGTGFAPFRGGPLRLADSWGTATVASALQRLATLQGPRFAPCPLLAELAAKSDGRFHADG